jgi:uncharacterized protein YbjT (DUF2867 family)
VRIVILGATGATGRLAVDEALAAGHEVVAYVRNPNAVPARAGLRVVAGSVEDDASMRSAFAGADAVISCLGARITAGTLLKGTDFQRRTLPAIIAAIDAASVPRFVLMSSFGIGTTRLLGSALPRILYHRIIAGRLFDDKWIAERALPGCRANWTAVYPVTLQAGAPDVGWDLAPLDTVEKVEGIPVLSFATVAKVLVGLAPDRSRERQRLLLAPKGSWR